MEPGPTLILKAGDKLVELEDCPGDFEDWIAAGLGPEAGTLRVLDVRAMPELPEITLYIDALDRRITGATLERIRIASPSLLRTVDPPLATAHGRTVAP